MKKIVNVSIVLLLFTMIFGCDEDLLFEKPDHLITADLIYSNLDGFEAGLNGLHSQIRTERGAFGSVHSKQSHWLSGTDLFTSNIPDNNKGMSTITANWGTTNSASHKINTVFFLWFYEMINAANTIIDRAENPDVDWAGMGKSPEENKMRIIAEATAIRAYIYLQLTYLYGDVPLSLEESSGSTIKTDWARTPAEEVCRKMITDLLFAEKIIGVEASLPGRMTKGAVQTLLAEMYLVVGEPENTILWADQVINNPSYSLITERYGVRSNEPGVPFMDMFYDGNSNREDGNTESLWTFNFEYAVTGGGTATLRRPIGSNYSKININGVSPFQLTVPRGGRMQGWIAMTKFALDLYEPQDDRGSDYAIRKYLILKTAEENAPAAADNLPEGYNYGDTIHFNWSEPITPDNNRVFTWPWTRKLEEGTDPNNVRQSHQFADIIAIRLADTYLLKAEAQLLTGNQGGATETINIIRRRSNASEVSAVDIDFLLDERGRELVLEGHRRNTLVRLGKWLERVQAHDHNGGLNATERDALFPIPQVVIDANLTSVMPNNPGY